MMPLGMGLSGGPDLLHERVECAAFGGQKLVLGDTKSDATLVLGSVFLMDWL